MIPISINPHLINLPEKQLIIIAQKNSKYSSDAKNILLKKYQPYISKLMQKYPSYIKEDLESIAYVGLLKAIENFDINKNNLLITYAQYFIKKEISKYIKNDLEKKQKEVSEFIIDSTQDIDFDTYESQMSLSETQSLKITVDNTYNLILNKERIRNFVNELTLQQSSVIDLIYFKGLNNAEAAKILNISKARVTQLLASIKQNGKKKLSKYLIN